MSLKEHGHRFGEANHLKGYMFFPVLRNGLLDTLFSLFEMVRKLGILGPVPDPVDDHAAQRLK